MRVPPFGAGKLDFWLHHARDSEIQGATSPTDRSVEKVAFTSISLTGFAEAAEAVVDNSKIVAIPRMRVM